MVEIVQTNAGYQLMRGGNPYIIKGAGMGVAGIESFAAHGGNSIRNWTTTGQFENGQAVLDKAHANGVTVALCLAMRPERSGFDYDDAETVAAQLDEFREEVLKYRDHPALLVWIIGNELNLEYTNSKVYDAVNDISRMIHKLDPNHPTTTAVAGFKENVIFDIQTRAPDVDFISFQLYGGLFALPAGVEKIGFEEPFMVTEWGTIGHWEVDKTSWGAPIEATSTQKADKYRQGFDDILSVLDRQMIGSYAFLWGQKQERTPTWYGLFTETGDETEAIDVLHFIWNGEWPQNRSPQIRSMQLDGRVAEDNVILTSGGSYAAAVDVFDQDDDQLTYQWELRPESDTANVGGDYEQPIAKLEGCFDDANSAQTCVMADEPGAYRLFVVVYDGRGHAAHANIPFFVESGSEE